MERTIVKVCGLTRLEDARVAREAGADWLGFVLKDVGPRCVDADAVGRMVASLGDVTAVAVMVAPTPDEADALARRAGASRIQLHRVDPAAWPSDFPWPVAFAIPVGETGALRAAAPGPPHVMVLDTAHPTLAGGTGRTFAWDAVAELAATRDVMIAGGLDGDNVVAAIERVKPFGVDASSRLEVAPGIKDPERVRRFVAAVRAWDEGRKARA